MLRSLLSRDGFQRPVALVGSFALFFVLLVPVTALVVVDAERSGATPPSSASTLAVADITVDHVVASSEPQGDGSYLVTFEATVTNSGEDMLNSVQVTTDLTLLGDATSVESAAVPVAGGADPATGRVALTANPDFTGTGQQVGLLTRGDSLAPAEFGTVTFGVSVRPGPSATYTNVVAASAVNDSNEQATDQSSVLAGLSATTVGPSISVTNTAGQPTVQSLNNSLLVAYEVTVTNTGSEALSNVRVEVDFGTALGSVFRSLSGSPTSGLSGEPGGVALSLNSGYDGTSASSALLDGSDMLAPGEHGVVTIVLVVEPTAATVEGSVSATATGGGVETVAGESPVASYDHRVSGLRVRTEAIGVAVGEGSENFIVTYQVKVLNFGNQALGDVQVSADLATVFADAEAWALVPDSVSSTGVGVNGAFTGRDGNTDLLTGNEGLAPGAAGSIDFGVSVTTAPQGMDEFTTSVSATANGHDGEVTDLDSAPGVVTLPPFEVTLEVVDDPVALLDGTYEVTYQATLFNRQIGNLLNVGIVADLEEVFGTAGYLRLVGPPTIESPYEDAVNDGFTGRGENTQLVGSPISIGEGGQVRAVFKVIVEPSIEQRIYEASVSASASSRRAVTTVTSAPVEVDLPLPGLEVTKSVVGPLVDDGAGEFTVNYRIVVENTGNADLSNVQVDDDLAATFATASEFLLQPGSLSSDDFVVNPDFTGGAGSTSLLAGGDGLAPGAFGTVDFAVVVTPGDETTFYHVVTGFATGEGVLVEAGVDSEPLTLAISAWDVTTEVAAVDVGSGQFIVSYEVRVENTGSRELGEVQLTDDLEEVFRGVEEFVLIPGSVLSSGFEVNAGFTGRAGETDLLTGSDVLAPGGVGVVGFEVLVTPGAVVGPFMNTFSGEAVGEDGRVMLEVSSEPVTLPVAAIEITAHGIVANAPGETLLTYYVRVENRGDQVLRNVQATMDLAAAFGDDGWRFSGLGLENTGGIGYRDLEVNSGFSGRDGDTNLLLGGDTLNPGQFGLLVFAVVVATPQVRTEYSVTASASADGLGGGEVADVSPPVVVSVPRGLHVTLSRASGAYYPGDGSYQHTYQVFVRNDGDRPLSGVQLFADFGSWFGEDSYGGLVGHNDAEREGDVRLPRNDDFTGVGSETALLADGGVELAPGDKGEFYMVVRVVPSASRVNYGVAVVGSATESDGNEVTVQSRVVSTDLPVSELGVTKSVVGSSVDEVTRVREVTYQVVVANTGNTALDDVEVTDDLATSFATVMWDLVGRPVSISGVEVNSDFTGADSGVGLLGDAVTLMPGESGVVEYTVSVTPSQDGGDSLTTTVVASGTGHDGRRSADFMTQALPVPSLGLTARVVSAGNDLGNAVFEVDVENTGNVALTNVRVLNDLAEVFSLGNGGVVSLDVRGIVSSDLEVNTGFDGVDDTGLLAEGVELGVGESGTVQVVVSVVLGGQAGPYVNRVSATAVDSLDMEVAVSAETEEFSLFVPAFVWEANVFSKEYVGDGKYEVVFELVATSTYTSAAVVEISYDLAGGSGGVGTVVGPPVSSDFDVNLGFTGTDPDTALLVEGATLDGGETGRVRVRVLLTPDVGESEYVATFNGSGAIDNGFAAARAEAVVAFEGSTISASIGAVTRSGLADDGSFEVEYEVVVENTGETLVSDVQLTNDLVDAFGSTDGWSLVGVPTSDEFVVNAGFTGGDGGTELLTGGDTLDGGETGTVTVTVSLTPDPMVEQYLGKVFATATSVGGPVVRQLASLSVPARVSMMSVDLDVVGEPEYRGADGSYVVTYGVRVRNSGGTILDSVQVTDDLESELGSAVYVAVVTAPSNVEGLVDSSRVDLSVDGAFTGRGDQTDLLDGSDTLEPGEFGYVEFSVRVEPVAGTEYVNRVVASSAQTSVVAVREVPLPVSTLGVSKSVGEQRLGEGGSFTVAYGVTVTNTGNTELTGVQVTDDLATVFADASVWSVVPGSITSGGLGVNGAFTGMAEGTGLLAEGVSLNVGESDTIQFTVSVTPGDVSGPYTNSVTAAAEDPTGAAVTADRAESGPVFFRLPALEVSKTLVSGPSLGEDGSFTVTYGVTVTNTGNTELTGVQVTDDLESVFADASVWSVEPASITSGGLAVNGAFTGMAGGTGLLGEGVSLNVGESDTIQFMVSVTPGDVSGPYTNSVTAAADGGDVTADRAESGPVFFRLPALGVSKTLVSGPSLGEDGSFTVTYGVTVTNGGNTELSGVQVTDDLATVFADASVWSVVPASITSGRLDVNGAFSGMAEGAGLLAEGVSLNVGESDTIQFMVSVTPGDVSGPYTNSVTAAADGGDVTADRAESNAVTFPLSELGVSKTLVSGPSLGDEGSFTVTYGVTVTNAGTTELTGVQVTDDLATVFADASVWSVVPDSITSVGEVVSVNGSFTGMGDSTGLLGEGVSLAVGESDTIQFTVSVTPGEDVSYSNSVEATATGHVGSVVATDGVEVMFVASGGVMGVVWLDSDGDGVVGDDEVGISGVTVRLVEAGADGMVGTADDVVVRSVVTDGTSDLGLRQVGFVAGSGAYSFMNVPVGDYGVVIDVSTLPADVQATYDGDGGVDATSLVTVSVNEVVGGVSFGFVESFDLELVVVDSGDVAVGGMLTYTVSTASVGAGPVLGPVELVVNVAEGLTVVSASGSGSTCVIVGQVVTCTWVDGLGVDDSSDVVVVTTVTAAAGDELVTTALVRSLSGVVDLAQDNNGESVMRVVGSPADTDTDTDTDGLPVTGLGFGWLWLVGGLLVVVGALGVLLVGRRRGSDVS